MAYADMLFLFVFLILNLLSQTLPKTTRVKNIFLLFSSLVFFCWAGPIYILIPVVLTLVAWIVALLMQSNQEQKKKLLTAAVILQILILVVFKYTGFLLGTFQGIFGVPSTLPQIILPLGLSVYSLELISYLVDVYRGETAAQPKFWLLLTYASLFHVSLGGPVLRYGDVEKSLRQRKTKLGDISTGITRISIGLAKKFLLADSLESLVNTLLVRSSDGLAAVPVTGLWLGVILSALKYYLLFSAYADVAIGLGLISGFRYKENFDYPLASCSLRSFCSKWFISISSFFQDYVRTPLTGRTKRPFVSLCIACALMGLWFGGGWNYVLWGLYLAVFLTIENRWIKHLPAALSGLLGIVGIFFSFVIFSFTTLSRLGIACKGLFGMNQNGFFTKSFFSAVPGFLPLILISICFAFPIGRILHNLCHKKWGKDIKIMTAVSLWESIYPIVLLIITAVYLIRGGSTPFLTF